MPGKEPWEIYAEFNRLAFEDAKEDRLELKNALEGFRNSFNVFVNDEFRPLKTRVGAIERCTKTMSQKREEATVIKVAKITSRWEFWGLVIFQLGAISIALIALLK